MFYYGRLAMPLLRRENVRHATLLFCAEGVNVRTTGAEERAKQMDEMTSEELRKLKEAQPDDSIVISPYEGMSPQEAAKVVEIYDKKIAKGETLDNNEQSQYQAAQQIADNGGVLSRDLKPGNGPFLDDQDMMAAQNTSKEGE